MVDLTGLGTPKVAQQKTEDKRVEQEAGKAGTTFKMPPKVRKRPSISLAQGGGHNFFRIKS
jgi:hypothetical protein